MARKLSIDPRALIAWTTGTNYRIAITPGLVREVGNNKTYSPAVDPQLAFTSFSSGPYVTGTNYISSSASNFLSTVTLYYNRTLRTIPDTVANYNLYNTTTGLVSTISGTGTNVSFDGNKKVNVRINDVILPEGEYYFSTDAGVFTDNFNFPNIQEETVGSLSGTGVIKFYQTSLSNMVDRQYDGGNTNTLFINLTPQVVDNDLNVDKVYTLTLDSPIGDFSSPIGSMIGGVFVASTTKAAINAAFKDIKFTPTSGEGNPNSTYSYSLSKDSVELVARTLNLFGVPFTLDAHLVLSTNAITRHWYQDVPLTATFNTTTNVSGIGYMNFNVLTKNGNAVNTTATTATVVANVANAPRVDLGSTGTFVLQAAWTGRTSGNVAPYYYGTLSNTLSLVASERGDYPGDIVLTANDNIHQLSYDYLTFVESLSTATTGDITIGFFTSTEAVIANTPVFVTTNSFDGNSNYNVDISSAGLPSTIYVQGNWSGQEYVPLQFYPYWDEKSNTITQNITPGALTLYSTMTSMTIADPLPLIAVANTTTTVPGVIRFSSNTGTLSQATVSGNSASTSLPAGTFPAGVYTLTSTWLNSNPIVQNTNTVNLTVNERAPYPGTITIARTTPFVYQLSTGTDINVFGSYNTPTTGTFRLVEVIGTQTTVMNTGSFRGGPTSSIKFVPDSVATLSTNSHNIKVIWDGQTWTPGQFYPYYGTSSNTISQNVRYAIMTQTANTLTNTIRLPNVLTITVDDQGSDVRAGTVSFYEGSTLLGTTATSGSSASLTLPAFTLSTGSHSIHAIWNNVSPQIKSNTVTSVIVAVGTTNITPSSIPTWYADNLNGTPNTTATLTASLTGSYSAHSPSGVIDVYDNGVKLGSGAVTSGAASFNWNPNTYNQIDNGTRTLSVQYTGDPWYYGSTATTTFLAKVWRDATVTLATSSATVATNVPFTLTANITGAKYFDSASDGLVTFKNGSTVLGTAYFSGNVATLTTSLATATSYTITADWAGRVVAPRFTATSGASTSETVVPSSPLAATLKAIPNPFNKYAMSYALNENGIGYITTANTTVTTTFTLTQTISYLTHRPAGKVVLYDGTRILTSATVTATSQTSTISLSWRPEIIGQLDNGSGQITAVYTNNDNWNLNTTTSIAFTATSRSLPDAYSTSTDNGLIDSTSSVYLSARWGYISGNNVVPIVFPEQVTFVDYVNGSSTGTNIATAYANTVTGLVTATVTLSTGSHRIVATNNIGTYFYSVSTTSTIKRSNSSPDWITTVNYVTATNNYFQITLDSPNLREIHTNGPWGPSYGQWPYADDERQVAITWFVRASTTSTGGTFNLIQPTGYVDPSIPANASVRFKRYHYYPYNDWVDTASGSDTYSGPITTNGPLIQVRSFDNRDIERVIGFNPEYNPDQISNLNGWTQTITNQRSSSFITDDGVAGGPGTPKYAQNFYFLIEYFGSEITNSPNGHINIKKQAIMGEIDGYGNITYLPVHIDSNGYTIIDWYTGP